MAVGQHGRAAFVVWLGILSGCGTAPARPCTEDSECILQGRIGTCEAVGFCSYEDEACADSAGFGPYAGEGLAGECVGSASTMGSTTSAGSTGATVESSGGDVSTTQKATTGTCTTDCGDPTVEPAMPVELDGPVRLRAIALLDGGVAVGGERVAAEETGWLAVFDDDVETARWVAAEDTLSEAQVSAVDVRDDGSVLVAGARGVDRERPFLTAFDGDGALLWSRAWNTLGTDTVAGVAVDRNEAWVAGTLDDRGWVERVDAAGVSLWSQQWVLDASATRPEVVANFQGTVALFGARGRGGGARFLSPTGGLLSEVGAERVQAVDGGSSLIAVGDAVTRFDAAGDTLWSEELDGEARGVASTYDGGAWVIISASGGLEAVRLGPDGGFLATVAVDVEVADGVAVAASSTRAWLLVSGDDQSQLLRWRLSP